MNGDVIDIYSYGMYNFFLYDLIEFFISFITFYVRLLEECLRKIKNLSVFGFSLWCSLSKAYEIEGAHISLFVIIVITVQVKLPIK